MAVDMGSEIERLVFLIFITAINFVFVLFGLLKTNSDIYRQNKALNPLEDDIDELNDRVRGANQRTRRLLGK